MLFAITALDRENSLPLRLATRDAHFAYARETGVAKLGGPFLDENGHMVGSLIIIEADDLAAAKLWQADDPYAKAGLFAHFDIRPWNATLNNCDANL